MPLRKEEIVMIKTREYGSQPPLEKEFREDLSEVTFIQSPNGING